MNRIGEIVLQLKNGKIDISQNDINVINDIAVGFINGDIIELQTIHDILEISNILYNNTSNTVLPLEDGIYDLVVVKYNKLTGNKAPVGAVPTSLNSSDLGSNSLLEPKGLANVISAIPQDIYDKMIFYDALIENQPILKEDIFDPNNIPAGRDLGKIKHASQHIYPELVGTLHKSKFVLASDAQKEGVLDDPSVKIFERDFLYPTFPIAQAQAAYNRSNNVGLLAELKYDGVSIEAEVDGDELIYAFSRGDTENDIASNYTPIFAGKKFHKATGKIKKGTRFGIKFEAIITEENMGNMQKIFGKTYTNGRVGIIGILGSSDAYRYRDLITLVPICTSGLKFENPIQEVQFLNMYYSGTVDMKYAYLEGNYYSLLWQVNKFTEDAEAMRPMLPFMYDGVVISYVDPIVKQQLGRQKSINLWSMAIKFNALSKETVFTGYTFTIGQNGLITPMGHFRPVEFLGSIHDKTTVHSYKRFEQLQLRVGDIVRVTYRNDVICYLDKPYNKNNDTNPNQIIPFIDHCPSCGTELVLSDSGNSCYCTNIHCPERNITRITNMVRKLGMKDFSRAYLSKLNINSLNDLLSLDYNKAYPILGDIMTKKILDRIGDLKQNTIPDYRLIGSLGFSSISISRWKMILNRVSLDALLNASSSDLYNFILMVKGMGNEIAKTIVGERPLFREDIRTIISMPNVVITYSKDGMGLETKKAVRFTGFRSKELEDAFNQLGFDADGEKSVTKKTSILVIPHQGFSSSKLSKVSMECMILTEAQAWDYIKNFNK